MTDLQNLRKSLANMARNARASSARLAMQGHKANAHERRAEAIAYIHARALASIWFDGPERERILYRAKVAVGAV